MTAIAEVVTSTLKKLRAAEKAQRIRVASAVEDLNRESAELHSIQTKIYELEAEGEALGIQKDCGPMEIVKGPQP